MSNQAAFEHNGALVERSRFYAIACDPNRSVAVEACAGAGKTWMLVSRMVRALLDGTAPHEILAITFTRKAASEMRQRLHEWLVQFSAQSDEALREELLQRGFMHEPSADQLQRLRQLHHTLLEGGRMVQIRTFHSWFAALVRSAPMQALADLGLPSQYELLENDAQAVAQVWPRFQRRVAGDPDARSDYHAVVAQHGRHQTQKALEAALSKRVEFTLAAAEGVVDSSIRTFAQQFPAFAAVTKPEDLFGSVRVQELMRDAARLLGAASQKSCTDAANALERALAAGDMAAAQDALLTQKGTPRKLSDKVVGIETVRQAQDCLIEFAQAQAQHQAWQHQQRMARLTRLLVQDFAALKRERGWLDMGDLERTALALMSDAVLGGWVQERLDARVRHLMIDEFQDTNPLQWQALSAWLSGYAGAGHAPSVFLVGDPKQSIYRFRRAEPQVFKAAQRFVVEGLGGDLLSCDHTRRNALSVIGLVNAVMGTAQSSGEFEGFRAHSTESTETGCIYRLPRIEREAAPGAAGEPLESDQQPATGLVPAWRDSLTTPRVTAEETRKTLECRQAAQWIAQQLRTQCLQPGDVMVLARKRERLGLMQAELAALRIPAQQPEKNDLSEMPEVQDLVALMDVLVSPAHDLSLARVLKSPVFGASDADLVQLVLCRRSMEGCNDGQATDEVPENRGRMSWFKVLQQAQGLPDGLARVGIQLARWKSWVENLPVHDSLSAIFHDGDVLARYAAATPPAQRDTVLTHLRALLGVALNLDGGRYTTAYTWVRAMRAGGLPAPVRADGHAVRLLTIHGAKGLEAPLVLLLDSDGEAIKPQTMGVMVDWPGEASYPQSFVFLASESRPPACVAAALASEQSARKREELNALYVALTRAQRTMVLSCVAPHVAASGSWWQRLHGHAHEAPWSHLAGDDGLNLAADPDFALLCLQNVAASPVEYGSIAIKGVAESVATESASDATESMESRLGQAFHRLLERYVPVVQSGQPVRLTHDTQQARIAREFDLDAAAMARALAIAVAIVQGEGSWAWDSSQLDWQGNEVGIAYRGRLLRIDRLVLRRSADGKERQWWVLDYKSASHPHQLPELRDQLWSYRMAVALAHPGEIVRAAFLTAQGTLIELLTP